MAFSFGGVPTIVSGPGTSHSFGSSVRTGADHPWVVVTDSGIRGLGLDQSVVAHLEELGPVGVFDQIRPEPKVDSVDALARLLREHKASGVVALGGGSVMDVAKLAAVVADRADPAESYLLGRRDLPVSSLTTVMIPTTAGTGSEVTRTGIYSDSEGRKVWAWGNGLSPDLVIQDPTLSVGLPGGLTAATGVDALVHAIEAWTGGRKSPMGDMFAARAVALIRDTLPAVMREPGDLEARSRMLMAATYAGVAIDNGGTGVAHAVGHALGSIGPIHHGRAVALGMGATLAWNVEQAGGKYEPLAALLGLEVGRVPEWFQGLVAEAGLSRGLDWEWDRSSFLRHLVAAENIPMLENNAAPLGVDQGPLVCELMESWME